MKIYKIWAKKTEELCLMARKSDEKFEKKLISYFKKRQEFGDFWPEHSKTSKIFTFIGSFCAKYLTLDLRKYKGNIFHDT